MINTRTFGWRGMPKTVALAAIALLAGAGVQARARGVEPYAAPPAPLALFGSSSSSIGHSIITSRGPAFVTGNVGSMATIAFPGSFGQGFLMNNGNGSSTLFAPGAAPQTLITPR
jgi:hypothetical protein